MKKIILGFSLLLIFMQNGFAKQHTDKEWNKMIDNESDKVWKQIYHCNNEAYNHQNYGDVNICLKAQELIDKNPYVFKEGLSKSGEYNNIGCLYEYSKKNYLKAYTYYMKAAKLDSTTAQINLDSLCKKHSWACK